MQIAHPHVAAAIAEHSSFGGGLLAPYVRLASTVRAMRTLTFGSDAAAGTTAARINAIHDRVKGTMPDEARSAPSTYSARDPALLAWVHLTLVDSTLRVYEQLVGPLAPADRDRYCDETAAVATWFGVPEARIPRTRADVDAAIGDMVASGALVASPVSRELARQVLHPPLGWLGGPAAGFVRRLTASELPSHIRDLFDLRWGPDEARALERGIRVVRALRRYAPDRLTQWPESRT
jgi:uncharacterized protein (DUF2236 family)